MYGRWAYGFWQCKEHYQYQKALHPFTFCFQRHEAPLPTGVPQKVQYGCVRRSNLLHNLRCILGSPRRGTWIPAAQHPN